MLDRKHPLTQCVFRASGLMDGVMIRGQKMTVSPSAVRSELLGECLPLFSEMRELARDRFGVRANFILKAVDEYEAAIRTLAELRNGRIIEDGRDGAHTCPACDTPITKLKDHGIILCRECNKPFMAAQAKLDSSEGFGTWLI